MTIAISNAALRECVPPSERDLEAFQLVRSEQLSTREVAKLLQISQTRVRQVVKRVASYLSKMAPETKDPVTQYQRMYLAEALGLERMKYMYGAAMRAFERSCGRKTVVVESPTSIGGSRTVSRTTDSYGDVKYLQTALKISWMMAKVPDNLLLESAYAQLEPEEEASLGSEAAGAPPAGCNENPLDGACSGVSPEQAREGEVAADGFVASAPGDGDYETDDEFDEDEIAGEFAPAQRAAAMPTAPAKSEAKRPLNRHERRARERMLKKAKRKAR